MRTTMLKVAVAIFPAALIAQTSGQANGGASANVSASATVNAEIPRGFSAEARARLEALYQRAQDQNVPSAPIAQRVAEGQAKGAAEASILAAATRVEGNLEAAHQVVLRDGRTPTESETTAGANAIERGVTRAQLQALVSHAADNRSLIVAFDVLTELAARGVPVANAVAQVQSRLDAGLPDAAISALLGAGATGGATNGSASGAAAASGAARGTGGVTGSVTGTVTGALGRRGGGL
jgi:hypothetical protein